MSEQQTTPKTPIRPMYKGCGRPVLVICDEPYSLFEDRNLMLVIPIDSHFGAATYFYGEPKITTSCGTIEYDAHEIGAVSIVKSYHEYFQQASDSDIETALQSPKCSEFFVRTVREILENI